MPRSLLVSRIMVGVGQAVLPLACLAAIGVAPPVQGRVLLMPTNQDAKEALIPIATRHGARLVERGPFNGSMIVEGARDDLAVALLAHGILPLRAPRGGCGDIEGAKA
ncbi:MAG: hypothetical protein ABW164_00990 [Sphingobium sp.]